jgi:Uma2 family endonuclease
MIAILEKPLSVAEYFELEKNSEARHEFVNGNLITMPGETKRANRITKKIEKILDSFLNTSLFETFRNDVRLTVELDGTYRYPDLMVALVSDDEDNYAVTMPILIVEVLSESTYKTDTDAKLREYTQLPSLQYYIMVSQDEPLVQVFHRKGEDWVFNFYTKLDEIISLNHFEGTLAMKDLYEGIKLI